MKVRGGLLKIILFFLFFGLINQSLLGQNSVIHVGADNTYFPFEYLDDEKMPAGFDIDLLYALMKEAGLEVQITSGDWFIIKDQMRNGKFDMLAGMYYNPDRAEHYDFSMPYIIITHSLFVKSGNKIGSLNELKEDKTIRVVVENSSILHKYLTANGVLPERILAVENQLDALLLVEDSYTTCALLPDLQAKFIAKKNGLDDIKTVGLPILPREYAFAVSKGDTVLLNTINEGLTQMHRSGEYKEIFEKWFGKYNPTYSVLEEGLSIFWLVSVFMIAILIFVYLFMRFRLKKMITENKSLRNELKQTNQVLKDVHKSETLLRRIFEFSPFPIVMIHEEGYFVFTNSGFEDLFGKQSDIGGSVNHWLSLAIKKEDERNFIKSQFFYNSKDINNQSVSNSVYSLTTQSGEETQMKLFFVSIGNGQLLIFFSEVENNLGRIKRQDSSGNKAKGAKSLLLSHFSYDIRSPMNIIMGFSEMMKTEDLSRDEMKLYAASIFQNGQMLLRLLQNMGTLSKIDSGELPIKLESILVSDLVNTIYKQFKGVDSLESEGIWCSEHTVKDLVVNSDHEILIQILLNLLFYIDELVKDDSVTIGCELIKKNNVQFFINTYFEKEVYESLLQKMETFQKSSADTDQFFSSAKDLSLYVSLVLIKLLGSETELSRDEKDHKLKFAFSLPNSSKEDFIEQYKIKNSPKKSQQFKWEGKRILIADNNAHSLAYFKLIFKSTKAEIITAKDGREAYEQCRKLAKVDLVLMDWLMPIMDGETCTKLIKQLKPTLPVIAVTAFALGDERAKILQSGCTAYCPKPIDRDELLNYINTLFEN